MRLRSDGGLRVQVLVVEDLFLGLVDLVAGEAPLHREEHVAVVVERRVMHVSTVQGGCRVIFGVWLLVAAEECADLGELALVLHRGVGNDAGLEDFGVLGLIVENQADFLL